MRARQMTIRLFYQTILITTCVLRFGSVARAAGLDDEANDAVPLFAESEPHTAVDRDGGADLRRWVREHPDLFFGSTPLREREKWQLWLTYGVLGSALATVEFAAQPPLHARWEGDNAFDRGIRSALRGGSRSTRHAADTASDVLLRGVLPVMLVTDAVLTRSEYPLFKRILFDTSWLLTNELATRVAKVAAGRERPFVDPCQSDPQYVGSCDRTRDGNASFYSDHASTSATMAALMCERHLRYGEADLYDWLVCGTGAALSATTGILRITADAHHATDVIAGWASGVVFGYGLPRFLELQTPVAALHLAPHVYPDVAPGFVGVRLEYDF